MFVQSVFLHRDGQLSCSQGFTGSAWLHTVRDEVAQVLLCAMLQWLLLRLHVRLKEPT